jgi:acyl carrier protein
MAETISSRTPDGAPNWCPVCRSAIYVTPSPMGDAPCPQCGVLLWLYDAANGPACCEFAAIADRRDQIFRSLAASLGVNIDAVVEAYASRLPLNFDSLDLVEMIMELEEEFDIEIPDERAEEIKTFRDLVDYLLRFGL